MNKQQPSEDVLIAQFVLGRIFPAIADFAKANNISVSVESAAFSYLALRLLREGHSGEALNQLVNSADEVNRKAQPMSPLPKAAEDVPQEALPSNVVRFGKK